jgi:hypothetical protein
MPRGTLLNDHDKGQITALHAENFTIGQIATRIGRSPNVVRHFLTLGDKYGTKRFHGRKQSISPRVKRSIFKEVGNQTVSCAQVKSNLAIPQSRRTILRVIRSNKNLKYLKRKKKPALKLSHKVNRLSWARSKVGWGQQWQNVVFSDEKKFNLDGPDGFRHYWHDLRKEELIFSKHHSGTGTVMIWAGFSSKGKTNLGFVKPSSTALHYQQVLQTHLLPDWNRVGGPAAIFMEDNAPIHKAHSTKAWFRGQKIKVMEWPAYSPDLNPIENVWGVLARKVYANGKQFDNVVDLKTAVQEAWNDIGQEYLDNLVESMPNRVAEVIFKHGGPTKY